MLAIDSKNIFEGHSSHKYLQQSFMYQKDTVCLPSQDRSSFTTLEFEYAPLKCQVARLQIKCY